MPRAPRSLLMAASACLAAAPALAQQASPPPPPRCDEDRSSGEIPTITSRFDLKGPGEGGVAFPDAKSRAAAYCTQQPCTIDGKSIERQASIYGLALLHRRYVAGFRCLPPEEAPAATHATAAPLTYSLQDPSEIDAVLAKANARCAADKAKAELSDLQKKDNGFIAVFACAS